MAAGLYWIDRTFFRSEIEKILNLTFKFKFKFELPAQKNVSDLLRSVIHTVFAQHTEPQKIEPECWQCRSRSTVDLFLINFMYR